MRIGVGYDLHRLGGKGPLRLGGIEVEFDQRLLGFSDGDVALHAVTDALLGAAGLGDMGHHFPSGEERFRDADSRQLLRQALALVAALGYRVHNVDATIIAERPPLAPHLVAMRRSLAAVLEIDESRVNVKAKSHDATGAIGRGEAMAAIAVLLLREPEG